MPFLHGTSSRFTVSVRRWQERRRKKDGKKGAVMLAQEGAHLPQAAGDANTGVVCKTSVVGTHHSGSQGN